MGKMIYFISRVNNFFAFGLSHKYFVLLPPPHQLPRYDILQDIIFFMFLGGWWRSVCGGHGGHLSFKILSMLILSVGISCFAPID